MDDPTCLPVELWEAILTNLPAAEAVRFQMVSKFTLNLVRTSAVIQYKIQQFRLSTADGPAFEAGSFDEKLEFQRRWSQAWTRPGHAAFTEILSLGRGAHPEPRICGSLYAEPIVTGGAPPFHFDSIRMVRIPSTLRGVEGKVWTLEGLPAFERNFSRFVCEDCEDLLVIVQNVVDECKAVLLLLSCLTGATHPRAKSRVLAEVSGLPEPIHREISKLCAYGDMGTWSYATGHDGYDLRVWDWKRGKLLLLLTEDTSNLIVKSFAFMDERRIIMLVKGSADLFLIVFDCYALPAETCSPTRPAVFPDIPVAASFTLPPPPVESNGWCVIGIETRPYRPPSDGARFHWAPRTTVATVSLCDNTPNITRNYTLVIPLHALAAHLHDPPVCATIHEPVPWADWGMHTQMLHTGPFYVTPGATCGSRVCVRTLTLDQDVLCDFDPALVRRVVPDCTNAIKEDGDMAIFLREQRATPAAFDPPGTDWTHMRAPFRATLTGFPCGKPVMLAADGFVCPYGKHAELPPWQEGTPLEICSI